MDEEYCKQLCAIMGWDNVAVKIPQPHATDPAARHAVNNPGYCFLTFQSPAHAAAVLAQLAPGGGGGGVPPIIMPNSTRPFSVHWATAGQIPPAYFDNAVVHDPSSLPPLQPEEYSIFVGDLAPDVSNADLMAVFRDPTLGLRSDRPRKHIRPFVSCRVAKVQLDNVTGLSKGYGFVRCVSLDYSCPAPAPDISIRQIHRPSRAGASAD